MSTTAWLIGSNPSIGEVTITIDATGSDPEELDVIASLFAPQPQYLYSPNSFGALDSLTNAIQSYSAADLSGTDVYLTRDRKVRIDFEDGNQDPVVVEIDSWGGSGADAFQEMLGFTGSELIGSFSTFTAPETSPYLWSPNMIETPGPGRRGKIGVPYFDTAVGQAGTRRIYATTHNSGAINDFTFQRVLSERYWTETEEWGEYYVWWNFVQKNFYKFKLWREVNELDGSTEAATIGDDLGPYVYRPESAPITFPMARDLPTVEFIYTVQIPVVVVDEYE